MDLIFYVLFICNFLHMLRQGDCAESSELQFVQILFRHGDRTPIHLYPTDPNPESFWPEGLGRLTLLGRKQHYSFGKVLRERYKNFITTSPLEINIMSSDCDRCIKSAQSNVASFYAPSEKWKFESDVNWQPLPVSYIPRLFDRYLETDSLCPRATEERERIVKSEEGQMFIAEHSEMFKNLSYYSETPITNWTSASYLFDTLFIEKKYNLTIPAWVEPYWEELRNVSNLAFYWSFKSPLLLRLRAGPLLGLIVENMQRKLIGLIAMHKVHIFSAHDTNVAVMMQALNIYNMKQPPYCSALVFELHKMEKDNAVRILYYNSSAPEEGMQSPHVLTLDGCTEFCPLDFFVNYTKNLIPDNWEEECKERTFSFVQVHQVELGIILLVSSLVFLILVIVLCNYGRKKNHREELAEDYTYHLMSTEEIK